MTKTLTELLEQEGFLKSLFEAIPCGVLIMDEDRRVQAMNDVIQKGFGVSTRDALYKRGGEVLRCINANKASKGCGYSKYCNDCIVRSTSLKALAGESFHRVSANIQTVRNGKVNTLKLLLSAAPIEYNGLRLAVILLEDITELNNLKKRLHIENSFAGIIGSDKKMLELYETIHDVTDINVPVLIQGESGTGKELVASAIHYEGYRSKSPFVPVNCAALPENLLESELFGHVKGAFTGAVRDKKGRFELADGGTLFLDEIGDMSKVVQAKLLRVLQEGIFERVGGERSISADVRIISATNRDLKLEVEKGNFREDLFYRLNVVPIKMPTLRERRTDIPLLAEYFLKAAYDEGLISEGLSKEALALMMDYPWPGNVRELQSSIRFSIIKSRGNRILASHLPEELQDLKKLQGVRGPSLKLDQSSVKEALAISGGNKAKAARILGVGRATLYRFLSNYPVSHNT